MGGREACPRTVRNPTQPGVLERSLGAARRRGPGPALSPLVTQANTVSSLGPATTSSVELEC